MNTLVILAHPNPLSFNAAISKIVQEEAEKKGCQVKVKDLYAMNWNPVLCQKDFEGFHTGNIPADIKAEQADVSWADLIIMVAPVWWISVPAILKGYIDRVFSLGFAYEYTATGPRGKLTDKKALVITTSGGDEKAAQASGFVDTVKKAVVDGVFGFCGFAEYKHHHLYAVTVVSDEQRKQMLTEVRELIKNYK